MNKTIRKPSLIMWKVYYDFKKTENENAKYQIVADKHGVTREKIRQIVTKVQRYLLNDSVEIMTEEQVEKELQEPFELEFNTSVKFCNK